MSDTLLFTVLTMAVLGLLLAVVLYFVAKKFRVEEDPRIDEVESVMPGANCGGCGFAGCRAFAENAVMSETLDGIFCPVGGNAVMKKVAEKLGREVQEKAPMVAVVRCNGTCENRPRTSIYDGCASCKVENALYCGDTGCRYGCLGNGDCERACPFGAIRVNPATGLPEVDENLCTACGNCVKACPKGIIELRTKGPKNRRMYVSCMNREKGGVARKACSAACIGCRKCEKVCPFGAITVEDNLSYIDFTKCRLCRKCFDECPTHAIRAVNFPPRPAKSAAAPAPQTAAEAVEKPGLPKAEPSTPEKKEEQK